MLIGDNTPQLMPVPQSMNVIQSPDPKIQVTPAIYQPVPYAPATEVPVASISPSLDFSEPDLPQEVITPEVSGPLVQSAMSQQQPIIAAHLAPSMEVKNPQAAVPFMVSSRAGGMVAMNGLDESNGDAKIASWLALIALGLVAYGFLRKK